MNNSPNNGSFDLMCIFFQNSFNCFISQKLILFLCFIFTNLLGSNEIRLITWFGDRSSQSTQSYRYEVLSNYQLRLVITHYKYARHNLAQTQSPTLSLIWTFPTPVHASLASWQSQTPIFAFLWNCFTIASSILSSCLLWNAFYFY